MPQPLLPHLELCSNAPQQSGIGMTEGMPSDALLDSNLLGNRPNLLAQNCLSPVWLPSPVALAGKNPVVRLRVGALFSPPRKSVAERRAKGDGLLRRYCPAGRGN